MMEKQIQTLQAQTMNLIEILNKEYGFYKDLLELSKVKKKFIVENKVSEIDKVVKLEQNIIVSVGQHERLRETEVGKLCLLLGLKSQSITVTELAVKLPPILKGELIKVQNKLSGVIGELKSVNDVNGQLIKQSLEFIDFSMNLITSANSAPESLYDGINNKEGNRENKKRLFDTKI